MGRNLDALQEFYAAFNARDLPRILAVMDREVEFHSRFAAAGGAVYRGHDGVAGWWADLAEAWETIAVEPDRAVELGPDTVLSVLWLNGRGRASGLELHEPIAHETRWREGRLARLTYRDRAEAEALVDT